MNSNGKIAIRGNLRKFIRTAVLYSGVILFADFIAFGIDSLLFGRNLFHYFTLFTLAEAGLLFLAGGAVDVSGSVSYHNILHASKPGPAWSTDHHRKTASRAIPLVLAALFLLVASFLLAYPLN